MAEMPEQPDINHFRRAPEEVMRLARMGSAHPTRLSFLRIMLRRMISEGWRFDRRLWEVDARGVGRAVYCLRGPERTYSLVAFAHDLPSDFRTDRVIATAWDATFALYDGVPSPADLDRLATNVPLQEAGRVSIRELCLSRANRSVRLFQHVVEALAAGRQPDRGQVDAVGYLMRTTAVYGSGKFGAADRSDIAARPEVSGPFQAEMLSVWLTRQFTVDLVEHLASAQGGPKAVRLDPEIKLGLGIGNSTGLGMAPFLVRHPVLLHRWMQAREEALARVRAQPDVAGNAVAAFQQALAAARENADQWRSEHPGQLEKLTDLKRDLDRIHAWQSSWPAAEAYPWDELWRKGQGLAIEGQEALLALMLEPHGHLVDHLAETMSADETASFRIDGQMHVGALRSILKTQYDWALSIDFSNERSLARFWYISEEKLEPRLGDRLTDAGVERELPLGIARLASALNNALAAFGDETAVARFLLRHPEHRYMVRRVQLSAEFAFAEVRDNLNAAEMLPIDLLRCKLAFFGASRFDPRSDRWVRISLFQNEPYPADLTQEIRAVTSDPEKRPEVTPPDPGLSLNEIEALCLKAARGGELSWGLAEEAGFAARWLHERGMNGPGALLERLECSGRISAPDIHSDGLFQPLADGVVCPIAIGTAWSDFAAEFPAGARAAGVGQPLLLLPFVHQIANAVKTPVIVTWRDGEVRCSPDGIVGGDLEALETTDVADVAFAPATKLRAARLTTPARRAFSCDVARRLEKFATLTVVPATATSRANAGSVEDDND